MANDATLTAGYFEQVYAASDDPWGFATRWYERRKYDLTLAALPNARYRRAFEPGCSIGILSEGLATRCDELVCCDLVPRIAGRAQSRLAAHPGASVVCGGIPEFWPGGTFDLVVLGEVGYYLGAAALSATLANVRGSLEPGGHLVSVHYSGTTDYPLSGAEVQAAVAALPGFVRACAIDDREFSLLVMQHGN